jgi:hypothetical protein
MPIVRQDVWAHQLITRNGPFCGAPYLVDQSFYDPAVVLKALKHWLVKLADTCMAGSHLFNGRIPGNHSAHSTANLQTTRRTFKLSS